MCGDLWLVLLPRKKGLESGSILLAIVLSSLSTLFIGQYNVILETKKVVRHYNLVANVSSFDENYGLAVYRHRS